MFVVILKYKVSLDEVLKARPAHIEFLDKFYKNNKIIISGRKYSDDGGVIVINSNTNDEVDKIMKQDPFIRNNIASYELIGFNATKKCVELMSLDTE
jgi:uncharacterized protein YciI